MSRTDARELMLLRMLLHVLGSTNKCSCSDDSQQQQQQQQQPGTPQLRTAMSMREEVCRGTGLWEAEGIHVELCAWDVPEVWLGHSCRFFIMGTYSS